jgi:hypothetical protein
MAFSPLLSARMMPLMLFSEKLSDSHYNTTLLTGQIAARNIETKFNISRFQIIPVVIHFPGRRTVFFPSHSRGYSASCGISPVWLVFSFIVWQRLKILAKMDPGTVGNSEFRLRLNAFKQKKILP